MVRFSKMHGAGNDYVYVNCFSEKVKDPSTFAQKVSDRHFGIGSDGLVLIMSSEKEDVRMRMFNADGSEAQMCGNASRCVGKYVYEHGIVKKEVIRMETLAGTKVLHLNVENKLVDSVTVDMGEPLLKGVQIPVKEQADKIVAYPLSIKNETFHITCVSMGNPHCIVFVEDVDHLQIEAVGPQLEVAPFFPEKTNVEFVEVVSPNLIKMRVWERGSGETLACGTGACATLVATVLNQKSDRKATLCLLGGELEIEWRADNHIYMTGPATHVFDGVIEE